jgi:hypothetical protein
MGKAQPPACVPIDRLLLHAPKHQHHPSLSAMTSRIVPPPSQRRNGNLAQLNADSVARPPVHCVYFHAPDQVSLVSRTSASYTAILNWPASTGCCAHQQLISFRPLPLAMSLTLRTQAAIENVIPRTLKMEIQSRQGHDLERREGSLRASAIFRSSPPSHFRTVTVSGKSAVH